jgi:hypothetical protein
LDKKSRKIFEKPKKERDQEVIDMLQSAGIKNPEELYERMKGVGKASVHRDVLRFNKLN